MPGLAALPLGRTQGVACLKGLAYSAAEFAAAFRVLSHKHVNSRMQMNCTFMKYVLAKLCKQQLGVGSALVEKSTPAALSSLPG
jgi:hypothetical protein